MYNYAINGLINGYLLVLVALGLNLQAGDKLGVVFAILCFACAYFSEMARVQGKFSQGNRIALGYLVFCPASYVTWLVG